MNAVQIIEVARDLPEAQAMLDALSTQDGFLGGRILLPSPCKPSIRVQGFQECSEPRPEWLPDGMRFVFIPPSQFAALGIGSAR